MEETGTFPSQMVNVASLAGVGLWEPRMGGDSVNAVLTHSVCAKYIIFP